MSPVYHRVPVAAALDYQSLDFEGGRNRQNIKYTFSEFLRHIVEKTAVRSLQGVQKFKLGFFKRFIAYIKV